MGSTIEYYNQNAQSFANGTAAVNFTEIQNVFLELIPEAVISLILAVVLEEIQRTFWIRDIG